MKLLISQPFGLGDCIYSMQLARNWIADGHEVTWPVYPQFVIQLQRAYPEVNWIDWTAIPAPYDRQDEHDWNGYRYIPLRWANERLGQPYVNCMRSKYDMFNLDFQDWREGAGWVRDEEKEQELLDRLLIQRGDEYVLINQTYGSDSGLSIVLPRHTMRTVELKSIPGFSLFDWAAAIEGAICIHTVSTSILFILEMLELPQPIHLYPRRAIENDFRNVDYLFTKPYILHD